MTYPPQTPYAAPVSAPRSGFTYKIADLIVTIGGLLIFFFSFAPFFSAGDGFGNSISENSWHSATSVFTALSGLVLVASAFLDTVWRRDRAIIGIHRHVFQTGVALYALVNLIGFAFGPGFDSGLGSGWGEILQLVGALAATAGAILNLLGLLQNPVAVPQQRPPYPPGGYQQYPQGYPPQGYPQQQGYQQFPPAQGYQPPTPQGYGTPAGPSNLPPTQAG